MKSRTNQMRKAKDPNYEKLQGKAMHGFRRYAAAVMTVFLIVCMAVTCFAETATTPAAGGDPIKVIGNLSDFIFGLIRAVGMILLGLGVVQIGLSLKSHDPSQRANGFLTLAGGVVITFAKEILDLITG